MAAVTRLPSPTRQNSLSGHGIILVFDLDQTIIDTGAYFNVNHPGQVVQKNIRPQDARSKDVTTYFNPKIIDILRRSICHKGRGVDAIFLLTNNSSEEFVRNCDIALSKLLDYKSPYWNKESFSFFDNYMIRFDRRRTINNDENSWISKKLYDVRIMLDDPIKIKSKSYSDIARRTYFFDDQRNHRLISELAAYGYPDHFVFIRGQGQVQGKGNHGFTKDTMDITDYSAIYRALDRLDAKKYPLNSLSTVAKRTNTGFTKPISHRNMYRITHRSHRHIKGNSRNTELNPILEELPLHHIHRIHSDRQKYCQTRRSTTKKLNSLRTP
jgi:hypothetical protein